LKVKQKLRLDILYSKIMWFWPKSQFHHKSHQLSNFDFSC